MSSLLGPEILRTRASMDERRPTGRSKRQAKAPDEGFWDCSVCTYRNPPEAFKCEMCDVRKGTSTRKPRINSQMVAQQVAQQFAPPGPPKKEKLMKKEKHSAGSTKRSSRSPRLKNVDRSTASHMAVTVGNVTVVITDYQPKDRRTSSETASNDLSDSSDSASYTMTNDHVDEDSHRVHNEHADQDSETDTNS